MPSLPCLCTDSGDWGESLPNPEKFPVPLFRRLRRAAPDPEHSWGGKGKAVWYPCRAKLALLPRRLLSFRAMLLLLPAALLFALAVAPRASSASSLGWLFPTGWGTSSARRFTDEKLIDAGPLDVPGDADPAAAGTVAAWLDWNGDQHLDLVLLAADQRSFAIHTWDRTRFRFEPPSTAPAPAPRSDFVITNVVPGDYDFDGKIDLLVMGSKNPAGGWWGKQDDATEMRIYLQQPDGTLGESHMRPDMVSPSVPRLTSPPPARYPSVRRPDQGRPGNVGATDPVRRQRRHAHRPARVLARRPDPPPDVAKLVHPRRNRQRHRNLLSVSPDSSSPVGFARP